MDARSLRKAGWGILLLGQLAWAAGGRAAFVKEVQGTIRVGDATLAESSQVQAGTDLKLPQASRLLLHFYSDGHREELSGPCFARVAADGCHVLSGGPGSLVRIVNGERKLMLPQVGNVDRAGGQVAPVFAMASGGGPRPPRPIAPAGPQRSLEDEKILVSLDFQDGKPRLERLPGTSQTLLLLDEKGEQLAQATDDNPLSLPSGLKAGATYTLRAEEGVDQPFLQIRFRLLDREEDELFHSLDEGDPLGAAAGYESLGLPHLEAASLERALVESPGDCGILDNLVRLYDSLGMLEHAKDARARAQAAGLKL